MNEPEVIQEILQNTKTIAVVGLTDKEGRASVGVSRFMQQRGYRIIPVNPQIDSALGEKAYATLDEAAAENHIDLVNVFRAPEFVPEVVKDTMRLKIPYLWLQEGVVHDEAAAWAEADGIKVVMDRCILKDHMAPAGDMPSRQTRLRRKLRSEDSMRFSVTHARGFVGSNITVSVQADEKEFIRTVDVNLDGDDLEDYQAPDDSQSYTREFSGVGNAGPGTEHTLIITATDQNEIPHSSTTRWTDII